uniref:Glycerate kinase n=1 Tax=Lactococcus garvieae DCC43 TaxID=1231377 RepID=K2PXR6_9LACT|nr:glycerate kinase [Lactococcus garvieae]EKF52216.1 Glycerate kinase [Lactococcus garvieae DCC43]
MKIFIASDSFKGSVSSKDVAESLTLGLLAKNPQLKVTYSEIADGGEGSLSAILAARPDFAIQTITSCDLLGRDYESKVLIGQDLGKKTAIVESADLLGLNLVSADSTSVEAASSYGLGLLIQALKEDEVEKIIVFLGGTGSSDGGGGFLQALGVHFLEEDGQIVHSRKNLLSQNIIDIKNLEKVLEDFSGLEIIIGSDVTNPYTGPNGAQAVFGKQKGATPEQITIFNKQMTVMNELFKAQVNIDLNTYEGSGAAGGLGGAFALLGGKARSGFDIIADLTGLSVKMADADLIITGEGSLDAQSAQGKVPMKVATLAKDQGIPALAVSGRRDEELGDLENHLIAAYAIQREVTTLEVAISPDYAKSNLELIGKNIAGMLSLLK